MSPTPRPTCSPARARDDPRPRDPPARPADLMRDALEYLLWRHTLDDGERTTLYGSASARRDAGARRALRRRAPPRPVVCGERRHRGDRGRLLRREPYRPLGEVWIDGRALGARAGRRAVRTAARVRGRRRRRACASPRAAPCRSSPRGDLLQAGPLLPRPTVRSSFDLDSDHEGFSAAAGQFDSDITDGRYPRAALGRLRRRADRRRPATGAGRASTRDSPMLELARISSSASGPTTRSTSTAAARPRSCTADTCSTGPYPSQNQPAPETRSVVTALVFEPLPD